MPSYIFRHHKTLEQKEVFLKISELEQWERDNPEWKQIIAHAPNSISHSKSVLRQAGGEWQDVLQNIKKKSGKGNNIHV